MTVVFPLIRVALVEYLTAALTDLGITVPVVAEMPRPGTARRYVLIAKPGGDQANVITDRPRLVTEVVDEYGAAAEELAMTVRALLTGCAPGYVGQIWVDRARHLGMSGSPDPDTHLPRQLITTELWVKGAALT